jgi:subtilisin family serine protease
MAKDLGNDLLVKIAPQTFASTVKALKARLPQGTQVEDLGGAGWVRIQLPADTMSIMSATTLRNMPGVLNIGKNKIITLEAPWKVRDPKLRAALMKKIQDDGGLPGMPGMGDDPAPDNPAIPTTGSGGSGPDPLTSKQWGMNQMGVPNSWSKTKGIADVVVAVIDTGVDYTHEDLVDNIWHNPGETGQDAQGHDKATNGIDDDGNGYVDDVIGWDFASNDNKPYDFTAGMMDMLMSGGNPGHGTHCAGNVAARADNGKGIAGVAPGVRIMPLRFITEKGQGTTADAVKAINYAVKMGAKVMSNSWGSEGDDDSGETTALKDAITNAMNAGVLFVAAAGNGHQGVGYDNDTDSKPGVPASYEMDNIISVAAINEQGALGSFSNWGVRTVDIAAPGVKVFSTVTQSQKYSDTVIDIPGMLTATWDGTSMACPHVAGAAALYMSINPGKDWRAVKDAILATAKKTSTLQGKVSSGGQLDVLALSRF